MHAYMQYGNTPLIGAAQGGHMSCVAALVDAGARRERGDVVRFLLLVFKTEVVLLQRTFDAFLKTSSGLEVTHPRLYCVG